MGNSCSCACNENINEKDQILKSLREEKYEEVNEILSNNILAASHKSINNEKKNTSDIIESSKNSIKRNVPSEDYAIPILDFVNVITDNYRKAESLLGAFLYNKDCYEDLYAINLGYYKLNNNEIYLGQWNNGERSGRGKLIWQDGSMYEG